MPNIEAVWRRWKRFVLALEAAQVSLYFMVAPETQSPLRLSRKAELTDLKSNLRRTLALSLLLPALILSFFTVTPKWLNHKTRALLRKEIAADPNLSEQAKAERVAVIARLDFENISLNRPPGYEDWILKLLPAEVDDHFRRLHWGQLLSAVLVVILGAAILASFALNHEAKRSRAHLIRCYRMSWRIAMATVSINTLLLVPLLAFGMAEFTMLLFGKYSVPLLLVSLLCGAFVVHSSFRILFKDLPMEFKEPLSRAVTPEDAPELWQALRLAAARMQTTPPDHVVIGMQCNFYVTELAVLHDAGRVEGKTLYLSHPLLKQMSCEETLAIVGHELGHFMGEDTALARELFPMRFRANETSTSLARAGLVGLPSCQLLNLFTWGLEATVQSFSREREFLADRRGAELTTTHTQARALVKLHVFTEAFAVRLGEAIRSKSPNPLHFSLQTMVVDKLLPQAEFWTRLFEHRLPHPLDSHPPLNERLRALGLETTREEARTMAAAEARPAYADWLSKRDDLFIKLTQAADAVVGEMRSIVTVQDADYDTPEGKRLLDALFPEQTLAIRKTEVWGMMALFLVIVAVCVMFAFAIEHTLTRIVLGSTAGLCLWGCRGRWASRHTSLILNAGGITYTRWRRTLRFKDVEQISARNQSSETILSFQFKNKLPPFKKDALVNLSSRGLSLSLLHLQGDQEVNAQTILRYFTRQPAEPASFIPGSSQAARPTCWNR